MRLLHLWSALLCAEAVSPRPSATLQLSSLGPAPDAPDWSNSDVAVINLDARADRLDWFELAMSMTDNLGLGSVCRVPAVNASAIWPELDGRVVQGKWDDIKSGTSRGAAGCALSHALAYRRIVELDLPYGIVMEDDITIFWPHHFPSVLKYIGSPTGVPGPVSGWDVVQLQTCPTGQIRDLASAERPPAIFNGSTYCAGMYAPALQQHVHVHVHVTCARCRRATCTCTAAGTS